MCRYAAPPGHVRTKPVERPEPGPLLAVIDAIPQADEAAPPKQRHTAKRVLERRRDEHGFTGGDTTVKDDVRVARARASVAGRCSCRSRIRPGTPRGTSARRAGCSAARG